MTRFVTTYDEFFCRRCAIQTQMAQSAIKGLAC